MDSVANDSRDEDGSSLMDGDYCFRLDADPIDCAVCCMCMDLIRIFQSYS